MLHKVKNILMALSLSTLAACTASSPRQKVDALYARGCDWTEIVETVYEEGGNAVADILYGNVTPSGKLSVTKKLRNKYLSSNKE